MKTYLKTLTFDNIDYSYYSLAETMAESDKDLSQLPYTLRIILESLLRKYDGIDVTKANILQLLNYKADRPEGEVPFKPSRVILQDFTGVPVVVDLASMREAVVEQGGTPELINPKIPVDLVVDHSVQGGGGAVYS